MATLPGISTLTTPFTLTQTIKSTTAQPLESLSKSTKTMTVETYTKAKTTVVATYTEAKTTATNIYTQTKANLFAGITYAEEKRIQTISLTKETAQDIKKITGNFVADMADKTALLTGARAENVQLMREALFTAPSGSRLAVAFGYVNSILSGDFRNQQMEYSFIGQNYSVVSIEGMDNTKNDAMEFRLAVEKIFHVENSAIVANYKHGTWGIGDKLQALGYELANAVDVPAVLAVKAIRDGIASTKGEVYVVAHSQGCAVFQSALSLLTPEERGKIHFQGFGPESYIDGNKWGLAEWRNVRNGQDDIPGFGNTGKVISGVLNAVSTVNAEKLGKSVDVFTNQSWDHIQSSGVNPRLINFPLYQSKSENSAIKNHHNFIKYYLPYLAPPMEGNDD